MPGTFAYGEGCVVRIIWKAYARKPRRRRSRAISFLELLSHATIVLTLTSVTCNCYMLPYTPRYKRRTRNATHYSWMTHVIRHRIMLDPFFRGERCASARASASGMCNIALTSRKLFFLRDLLLSKVVHSTAHV